MKLKRFIAATSIALAITFTTSSSPAFLMAFSGATEGRVPMTVTGITGGVALGAFAIYTATWFWFVPALLFVEKGATLTPEELKAQGYTNQEDIDTIVREVADVNRLALAKHVQWKCDKSDTEWTISRDLHAIKSDISDITVSAFIEYCIGEDGTAIPENTQIEKK